MTTNIRFLAIFILNIALTAGMLLWMKHNGIDINNTRIIDNLDNLSFIFDFIAFMVASVALNIILLELPSKKHLVIMKMIKQLSEKETIKPKRNRNAY